MNAQLFNVSKKYVIENSMKIVNCTPRVDAGKLKILWVVFFLLLHSQTGIVSAQELNISPTPKPVEYTLPYPGLLPDHPLYFLRAVRDAMQNLLASNPLKKAEFFLLQADKGVSASSMLSQKKETAELAGATALESQQYFEKALDSVVAARKQGLDNSEITKKLVLANEKHQEVLTQMKEGVTDEYVEAFTKAEEKAQINEKKVKSFLPAK
jgi:hypothetical protein